MPEFKFVLTWDGTPVAQTIGNHLTGNTYNLIVEPQDLPFPRPPSSSSSPSPSSSPDDRTIVPVLIVSPLMMGNLSKMLDEDRMFMTTVLKLGQPAVALSYYVPMREVKDKIKVVFRNTDIDWRYLEVGTCQATFRQFMVDLVSTVEERREDVPVPTLKKFRLLPDVTVVANDTLYIFVEKRLLGEDGPPSLRVVYKNGHQVTASRVAECLYQFVVPDIPHSTTIEVFTTSGKSLGTDTVRYREKLAVCSVYF